MRKCRREGTWRKDLEEQRTSVVEMSGVSLVKGACKGPEAGVELKRPRYTKEADVPGSGSTEKGSDSREKQGNGGASYPGFHSP